ncbi:MAG TPA: DUF3054 domain-containing protein [Phycicoccus sp.]|nr:DUF3054 domain-containing protein [Phycicoccus sp.]HQH06664.1 DUF3054 domain-containing protein [Phycicoccus sp.]HQK31301.1 DUF3054 domain-containing protein [Phycicoccus sp.]HQY97453.1 DUF3054 domain-containing protein [Phycicoccus sp.]HRA44804.1 DUF3054 domain-containing protein [Phycicoccus sp.]
MSRLLPVLLDAAFVVVFAAIGRRSHEHGLSAVGVIQTAGPFLCGAAAGWLLASTLTSLAPTGLPFGLVVVVATVVIGMLLRLAIGAGTAWSFVTVATAVLTVMLLGWRLLARLVGD